MVNSDLYSGRKSPLFLPPKSTEIGPVFVRVSGLGFYRVFLPVLRMPPTVVWEIPNWPPMALWLRPWEWSLETSLYNPSQSSSDTLCDDISLELRHSRNDGEEGTAERAEGVDVLLIADEVNPEIPKLLQRQDQVLGRPGKTIEAPDQDPVKASLLGIVHQLVKSWPRGLGPTDPAVTVLLVDRPTSIGRIAS